MGKRFERDGDLPLGGVARQDFYDLVEKAKPTGDLTDSTLYGSDRTLEVEGDRLQAALVMPRWKRFRIQHQNLTAEANTQNFTLFELGDKDLHRVGFVHAVYVWVKTAFSVPSGTIKIEVGYATDTDAFLSEFSLGSTLGSLRHRMNTVVYANAANEPAVQSGVLREVRARIFTSISEVKDATAGELYVYVLTSQVQVPD